MTEAQFKQFRVLWIIWCAVILVSIVKIINNNNILIFVNIGRSCPSINWPRQFPFS
jgi:hypothetical protein